MQPQLETLKKIEADRPLTQQEMIAVQWAISIIGKLCSQPKPLKLIPLMPRQSITLDNPDYD